MQMQWNVVQALQGDTKFTLTPAFESYTYY